MTLTFLPQDSFNHVSNLLCTFRKYIRLIQKSKNKTILVINKKNSIDFSTDLRFIIHIHKISKIFLSSIIITIYFTF